MRTTGHVERYGHIRCESFAAPCRLQLAAEHADGFIDIWTPLMQINGLNATLGGNISGTSLTVRFCPEYDSFFVYPHACAPAASHHEARHMYRFLILSARGMQCDGCHPKDAGLTIMATTIMKSIKAAGL
jgi:hypothetical protein